jgi:hypothetical protein
MPPIRKARMTPAGPPGIDDHEPADADDRAEGQREILDGTHHAAE